MAKSVAVVGASSDRRKFGNKAVRAYLQAGYDVYPIHPSEMVVEDQTVYRSIAEIPVAALESVAVYLPPKIGIEAVETFTAKPIGTVYLNPGADAPEVVEKAKSLGLNVAAECAILAVGARPSQFPDE